MKRADVVALITGLLLTGLAVGSLWFTFTGSIDWQLVRIVAPLALVVIGVFGLVLSRNKS